MIFEPIVPESLVGLVLPTLLGYREINEKDNETAGIDEAIELLKDFGNPKKWELLGGHYYRCRGKSSAKTNKSPHEIVQKAIAILEDLK